jgi:hypothetical protein
VDRGLDELTVTAGVAWTERRQDVLTPGVSTCLSYGHFVGRRHQAAFRFGVTMQEGAGPRYAYIFSYCPHLNPDGPVIGFLSFGFGLAQYPRTQGWKSGYRTTTALSFGGGVKAFIDESFAVRVEATVEPVGDFFSWWGDAIRTDVRASLGISWFFGGQEGVTSAVKASKPLVAAD